MRIVVHWGSDINTELYKVFRNLWLNAQFLHFSNNKFDCSIEYIYKDDGRHRRRHFETKAECRNDIFQANRTGKEQSNVHIQNQNIELKENVKETPYISLILCYRLTRYGSINGLPILFLAGYLRQH